MFYAVLTARVIFTAKTSLDVFSLSQAGIFLENNFKYQNANNNEFRGAISANYGGFFTTISCLLFDIFRGGIGPLVLGLMGNFKC